MAKRSPTVLDDHLTIQLPSRVKRTLDSYARTQMMSTGAVVRLELVESMKKPKFAKIYDSIPDTEPLPEETISQINQELGEKDELRPSGVE